MPLSKINSAAIANNAVVAADIADGTITAAKIVSIANTQITGNIISSQITSVGGSQITANTIANSAFQTGAVENYMNAAGLGFGMRNRIINGAMTIDQRNAGASITANDGTYPVDRFRFTMSASSKGTGQQQTSVVPVGFSTALVFTSSAATSLGSTDFYCLEQYVEGFNVADLDWGSANAKTVTLSFQVRSSLTGTFGGSLQNADSSRSYPFTYTISSANTWTTASVTIAGDTTGTWLKTNSTGIKVCFGLGVGSSRSGTAGAWASAWYPSATGATSVVGTNGATFYITGVQLEKGSTATSFDYRPFTTELQLCQRYFEKSYDQGTAVATNTQTAVTYVSAASDGSGSLVTSVNFAVVKRTNPTITFYTHTGTSGTWYWSKSGISETTFATMFTLFIGTRVMNCYGNTLSNWVPAYMYGHWTASAEL